MPVVLGANGFPQPAAAVTNVIAKPVGGGLRKISDAENRRLMRARFDSQFTTDDNRRHWQLADAMSIDASASWMVRRILRMRSRYEYHNNAWMMGGAQRLAKFVIGSGPRLHMATPNKAFNAKVEKSFAKWAKRVRLAEKLRISRAARFYNGEGVTLMKTNPMLRHKVKLDLADVEADQLSSPLFGMYPSQYPDQFFDGVVLDPWGNPETYHVLRQHPGAFGAFVIMGYEFDAWPARYVLHDYLRIRPGQQRGVPECIPALDLFADLRRYRGATLGAAETAADFAAVIQSQAAPDSETADDVNPMETIELRKRMATVLPYGYQLGQIKAEQPVTTYDSYTLALLTEISQTIDMPLFILTGDARLANMSSAYVASQSFIKSVTVDRGGYELHCDRVVEEFIEEGRHIGLWDGVDDGIDYEDLEYAWRWDRISQHADPQKMANAQQIRLENGTSSIPRECAMDGADWEEEQEADAKALGMSVDEYRAALRQKRFAVRGQPSPATTAPEPQDAGDDEGDEFDNGDQPAEDAD